MKSIKTLLEEHGDSAEKLRLSTLKVEDEHPHLNYALIEGSAKSLRFLGELFLALADEDECNIHIHPKSAGSAHFVKDSQLGLMIHRLPCDGGSIAQHK